MIVCAALLVACGDDATVVLGASAETSQSTAVTDRQDQRDRVHASPADASQAATTVPTTVVPTLFGTAAGMGDVDPGAVVRTTGAQTRAELDSLSPLLVPTRIPD